MKIEIRTTMSGLTSYTVAVIIDGTVREVHSAQHYNVIRVRNRLCSSLSRHGDTVNANEIPSPEVLSNAPF